MRYVLVASSIHTNFTWTLQTSWFTPGASEPHSFTFASCRSWSPVRVEPLGGPLAVMSKLCATSFRWWTKCWNEIWADLLTIDFYWFLASLKPKFMSTLSHLNLSLWEGARLGLWPCLATEISYIYSSEVQGGAKSQDRYRQIILG